MKDEFVRVWVPLKCCELRSKSNRIEEIALWGFCVGSMGSWKSGSMGLERMSVEQLKAVKEQTDLEVNLLQDSLNNIRGATTRLEIASSALNDLAVRPPANRILVPLTASLYVPATLHDSTHVLIDVGTGYFIEVKPHAYTFTHLGFMCRV